MDNENNSLNKPSQNADTQNHKRDVIIIGLAVLLILSLSLLFVNKYYIVNGIAGQPQIIIPEATGEVFDGQLPTDDPSEILAFLQQKVDENQFAFRINANPVFNSDCQSGNLRIENPARNRYGMQVELILDDTGESIYSSPYLSPNQYIESVALKHQLPSGDHKVTAFFTAIHPETKAYMGEVAAEIKITVSK